MKKLVLVLLAILIAILGFQQFAGRAVAPSPKSETKHAESSQELSDASEADTPASETGSVRSLPTAESIRSLADEYEKRVEAGE